MLWTPAPPKNIIVTPSFNARSTCNMQWAHSRTKLNLLMIVSFFDNGGMEHPPWIRLVADFTRLFVGYARFVADFTRLVTNLKWAPTSIHHPSPTAPALPYLSCPIAAILYNLHIYSIPPIPAVPFSQVGDLSLIKNARIWRWQFAPCLKYLMGLP